MPFRRSIHCRDALGRVGSTTVAVDETAARVTLMAPQPAASYDWRELDNVIATLQAARKQLPGRR